VILIGFFFLRSLFRFKDVIFSIRKQALEYQIHREEKHNAKQKQMETDINQILEKINEVGFDKLSQGEKDKLFEGSKSLHRDKKKD
jgi:hypothetical protein